MRPTVLLVFLGLVFSSSLWAQNDYQAQFDFGLEAMRRSRYDDGIAAFEKCLQLDDTDGASAYNLACCWALKARREEGLRWLRKSLELHFTDADHVEGDDDLKNLRGDPEFAQIVAEMRAATEKNSVRDYLVHVPAQLDAARPAPLLVVLHGAGGNAESTIAQWKALADRQELILLAVRGTVRVSGEKFRWDERSESVVLSVVREAQQKHNVDPRRVWLAGTSQGAYLAYTIALGSPDRFRAVVSIGGFYPVEKEADFPEAKKQGLAVFVVHGARDKETLAGARSAAQKMKEAGVQHAIHEHPGGREIPREEWPAVQERICEFLAGLAAR